MTKYYKITVANGNHPSTYTCTSCAEAFQCIIALTGLPQWISLDPDRLMERLIDMKRDKLPGMNAGSFSVRMVDSDD